MPGHAPHLSVGRLATMEMPATVHSAAVEFSAPRPDELKRGSGVRDWGSGRVTAPGATSDG